jgi:hypothetical protein
MAIPQIVAVLTRPLRWFLTGYAAVHPASPP